MTILLASRDDKLYKYEMKVKGQVVRPLQITTCANIVHFTSS